ncbi:hypothetical protein [Candidatus Lokiarchaeum ossiferum]|uniref:hypothetical protein n=1 Tax=Candidatus Lokiarchaeum ossiferum TaxID=2951803 RepID=UPI00352C57D7
MSEKNEEELDNWIKIVNIFLICLSVIFFIGLYKDITFLISGLLILLNLLLLKKNIRTMLYIVIILNLIRMIIAIFWVNHQFWPYFDYYNTYGSIFVILFTFIEIGLLTKRKKELTSDSMRVFFGITISLFLIVGSIFLLFLPKIAEPPLYNPNERELYQNVVLILNSLWFIFSLAIILVTCQILNPHRIRVSKNIIKIVYLVMSILLGLILTYSIVITIMYSSAAGTHSSVRLTDILIYLIPSSILLGLFYFKSFWKNKTGNPELN